MTRARNELHLCAPLKFAVTQQAKDGDAHVYGAKSRFMTDKMLDSLEKISIRTTATGLSRGTLLGLIHTQRPTTHLEAIGLLDCVLRFTGSHIDECKSARA